MLVTERAGRVLVFGGRERRRPAPAHARSVPDVRAELESGLMGIAVDGDTVFVCASRGTIRTTRAVARRRSCARRWRRTAAWRRSSRCRSARRQGAPRHQGCAVEIGPDGHLWVTIGDANLPAGENRAQDPAILNGKVLRLTAGRLGSGRRTVRIGRVYASAIAIRRASPSRRDGIILAVEHGTDVNDEINVIRPGRQLRLPVLHRRRRHPDPSPTAAAPDADFLPPAWASGAPTLATSGATFLPAPAGATGRATSIVSTLKEEDLRRFSVSATGEVTHEETLLDGRVRPAARGRHRS